MLLHPASDIVSFRVILFVYTSYKCLFAYLTDSIRGLAFAKLVMNNNNKKMIMLILFEINLHDTELGHRKGIAGLNYVWYLEEGLDDFVGLENKRCD